MSYLADQVKQATSAEKLAEDKLNDYINALEVHPLARKRLRDLILVAKITTEDRVFAERNYDLL